jgi:hypothetical protein
MAFHKGDPKTVAKLFNILWVALIVVMLHKTLLPWLGLSDGMAIALAVSLAILGNILAYIGFFDLLRKKLSSARGQRPERNSKEAARGAKSASESRSGGNRT